MKARLLIPLAVALLLAAPAAAPRGSKILRDQRIQFRLNVISFT